MTDEDDNIVSANIFSGSSVTQFAGEDAPSDIWILTTGVWNDLEFWDDNSFWND